jgi:hypothetical protein
MSNDFRRCTLDEFLGEFFPEAEDKAEIAAGIGQLRAEQRACRQAELPGDAQVTVTADHDDRRPDLSAEG